MWEKSKLILYFNLHINTIYFIYNSIIFLCVYMKSKNKYNLGKTSLMYAAENGYAYTLEELFYSGADINAKDNNG